MSRRSTRSGAFDVASAVPGLQSTSNGIAQSTVMYINSQYNHPAFSKMYLGPNLSQNGKTYGASSAVPKPPKAPEKPLMPYMRYSRKVWDDVKAHQPDLKLWEIGKIIGKMWRELQASDKQLYIDEYEAEKLEYQEQMKSYHNSPAYQIFLQAKSRAEAEAAAESRATVTEESCMSIEPIDDVSGDDEGYSVKHIAAARFQRNHRLMQDVLADSSVIPSGRGIVTEQRLSVLKNQVLSLEKHQTKLQSELLNIEKNHANTKRKWKDQANDFVVEMKRLRGMTPQEYYLEYKKKQQQIQQQQQQLKAASKESQAEDSEAPKTNEEPEPKSNEKSKGDPNEEVQDKPEKQSEIMEINNSDNNSMTAQTNNESDQKDAISESENNDKTKDDSVANHENNDKDMADNCAVEQDPPNDKGEKEPKQTDDDHKQNSE
uniref:SWI/SNF-related matrix-associated actin-dependent regulator of chromatin subfamily E member 1 n=1 Tax=Phallusia mammillata TaxID=59560 RepID=A0A6F9DFF7_9ASCI|nr:SWI/SNF-related matrix-associated actin-dependent regulator of chromatin subfamily E member 1 [Phallusia mammillata]